LELLERICAAEFILCIYRVGFILKTYVLLVSVIINKTSNQHPNKLHWSTKFNFFFVPRTSVDERFMLNSDMYTEFFYQAGFQIYRGI